MPTPAEIDLHIDCIGGNCPVQAEGTIGGEPFYFRARGTHWSIGIGGDVVGNPDWNREVPWGDGPFSAGWMPIEEAKRIIEQCAKDYMEGKENHANPSRD